MAVYQGLRVRCLLLSIFPEALHRSPLCKPVDGDIICVDANNGRVLVTTDTRHWAEFQLNLDYEHIEWVESYCHYFVKQSRAHKPARLFLINKRI